MFWERGTGRKECDEIFLQISLRKTFRVRAYPGKNTSSSHSAALLWSEVTACACGGKSKKTPGGKHCPSVFHAEGNSDG